MLVKTEQLCIAKPYWKIDSTPFQEELLLKIREARPKYATELFNLIKQNGAVTHEVLHPNLAKLELIRVPFYRYYVHNNIKLYIMVIYITWQQWLSKS